MANPAYAKPPHGKERVCCFCGRAFHTREGLDNHVERCGYVIPGWKYAD